MRLALLAAALLSTAAVAAAQAPVQVDMQTSDRWHAKAREIYARAISFQTVQGRNQSPQLAAYLQEQFRAGGLTDVTIHPHDDTAALILRWPAARPSGRKAILLMAHMDVVEARREDWSRDPFELGEEGGYFYGRGTLDDKQGVTAITTALLRLRAEGFQPDRDIIVLFTGDEETGGNGAELAANEWLDTSTDRVRAQRRRRRRRLSGRRPPARLRHPDRREDLSELHPHRDQPGRPQLAAAPGQCDLRARPHAAAARAAPLRADAERNHARAISPIGCAAPIRRSPPRSAAGSPIRTTARRPTRSRPRRPRSASPAPAASRPGSRAAMPTMRCRSSPARPSIAGSSRASIRPRCWRPCAQLGAPDNVTVEPVDQSPARPTPRRCARTWSAPTPPRSAPAIPDAAIVPDMSTGATDGLYFRSPRRAGLRRRRHPGRSSRSTSAPTAATSACRCAPSTTMSTTGPT